MFLKISAAVLCLFALLVNGGVTPSTTIQLGCSIPIGSASDWKVFWPLAFRLNGSLYPTQDDTGELEVWIPRKEKLIVSCGPNYLNDFPRKSHLTVKCTDGNKFLTESNEIKSPKDLRCDLRVIEEVIVPTVASCPQGATTGQFGYVHPLDSTPRIVGESCYNKKEGRTLFAHVRHGQNSEGSLLTEILAEDFFKNQEFADSTYKTDFMKAIRIDGFNERLRKQLGVEEIPGYQMANYIDMNLLSNKQLLSAKKLVWNYFALHDDLQETLELLKQDISELVQEDVDIYVGSHGVTKLMNSAGEKVPIYLDSVNKLYPIPEMIWIIVKKGKKAAAFAVINNPKLSESELSKITPCSRSKCEKISWLSNIESKGLAKKPSALVCCEYTEFRDKIKEVPRLADVSQFYI